MKIKALLNKIIRKQRDGYIWWVGVYVVFFGIMILTIMIKLYNVSISEDKVEDIITTSALGSLVYDKNEYALSQNYVLCGIKPGSYPNKNYEILIKLLEKNLGLSPISNGANYPYRFNGDSPYMPTDVVGQEAELTEVRFYNVFKDLNDDTWVKEYRYEEGRLTYTTDAKPVGTITTPGTGEVVTSTSVYLRFKYPVSISGRLHMVAKVSYTALSIS